ncbi:SH3 domain-containing protein [Corallococcus carmarthensis]|uniref:SH3 domain-containing protein n=1 Tax=Corallococcus carmarthensis TaxID=2316728 RepID=A0A3A8KK19_9BACT|nr:SH3 domain-containing protein [Corallococcus carmarthensis]NOK15868.1 SH3 domain-containing protein [Corallococcus carmarthensis]RKH07489.1 SH3 domain-containing protein [Corallococcus carmarthensis]
MSKQWVLSGGGTSYVVVLWNDAEAKDPSRRVAPAVMQMSIDGWMRTHRQALREMYAACAPAPPAGTSVAQLDALMKQRLSEAFKSGKLVGLTRSPSLVLAQPLSPVPMRLPSADVPPAQGVGIVMWNKTPLLQLRSSPEQGNNVLASLKFNTPVQVIAQMPGGWLSVSTRDGHVGFVSGDYVWSAPRHPMPEPNARLHLVAKGLQGTAIAIAETYYKDVAHTWGSDLRFFVAVLAHVNRRPIPPSTDGWKSVAFKADTFIWIPSKEFAKGLRGTVNSGSYSFNAVDAIASGLQRVGQLLSDIGQAIKLSLQYMPEAIAKHVEQALRTILIALLEMAVGAILLLAICTAVGAALGALAGGAGAAPGAAAGFEVGLALLEWMGLAFLAKWIFDSLKKVASAFGKFLGKVWDARGDAHRLDEAARELAEAIGVLAGVLVEALVMWITAKGAAAAIRGLKGTAVEKAFGSTRLAQWIKQRTTNYTEGKSPLPGPRQTAGMVRDRFIEHLAEKAAPRYAKELEPARNLIARVFKDMGAVQARAKDAVSAANRLQRAVKFFNAKVTTVEGAIANLWDAIGTRLILSDTSPAAMSQVVSRLAEAIRLGELEVTDINNLHGPGGKPYFTPEHLEALQVAAFEAGKPLKINVSKVMESGYTVVCAYLRHANGVRGELQIIGKEVLNIANAEHIPYDVLLHKPLIRNVSPAAEAELQVLVKPVEAAMASLSEAQKAQYLQYLNQSYIHARMLELGQKSTPPPLPPGLNKVLSVDRIQAIEHAIADIKAKDKAP